MGWTVSDAQTARDFLGVIAGSIITVTSITLSLLLISVQQGAASLTSLVFDQFLRRRADQFYFGFFIGVSLYSLILLSSITPSHQPVYGVMVAGAMTLAALYNADHSDLHNDRPNATGGRRDQGRAPARAMKAQHVFLLLEPGGLSWVTY